MSKAEIADNKWEAESVEPPIKSPPALAQIVLMGGLSCIFAVIALAPSV